MYFGGICFITDSGSGRSSYEDYEDMVRNVLEAGIVWIQYRDKRGSRRDIYWNALNLRRVTKEHSAVFVVNDHADIAVAVAAEGVHLGQDDLPCGKARELLGGEKLIGISTHTIEQAVSAEASGADYIGFGPIFHTATKDAGSPKGVEILHELRRRITIPIVAIGGITADNLRPVLETGIDAVAVASSILRGDIRENAGRFLEIIHSLRG